MMERSTGGRDRSFPSANHFMPSFVSITWGTWSFHLAGAASTNMSWGSHEVSM